METKTILNFDGQNNWEVVNDAVMGGVSEGHFEVTEDNILRLFGNVSPENNGGFASIKSTDKLIDLSNYSGIELKVKGDGKKYKLNLRTTEFKRSYYYQHRFSANSGQWQTIKLPFADFEAVSRGKRVFLAPKLAKDKIISFGLMISDKQFGRFNLELETLKAYL